MKKTQSRSYVTRAAILKLLSDEEIEKVSTAETNLAIVGEDYIDLEHPEQGVHKVDSGPVSSRHILPRSAVRDSTWSSIVTLVGR